MSCELERRKLTGQKDRLLGTKPAILPSKVAGEPVPGSVAKIEKIEPVI